MNNPDGKPPGLSRSLRTVTEENLSVSPEQFKAIVVWVTHRVLEQAFDLDELTAGEISITDEPDGTEELIH
ncbi:MAG: hypothetical protein H0T92_14955 [Pyrinomonadaceae bacterium]|nr:hypothetical protein [Pyrinomonadaceae bacterium]